MTRCIGLDVGGTKIRGVVLEIKGDSFSVTGDYEIPTESHFGYDAILEKIHTIVVEISKQASFEPKAIGFGTPGVLDPVTGLLRGSNTTCLNGKPLGRDLERVLGVRVVVENDANCFATAEHLLGAARGASLSFGVIMGTGVGGGIVISGRPRFGAQGIAGEWGHNVLEPDGAECYCGKRGCVETVISGPALERYYRSASGRESTLKEIYSRYDAGDPAARKTIDRLVTYFGKAMSVVVNILDPDVIVLGGGVSNLPVLYTEGVESVKRYIFNPSPSVRIVKNEQGASAGVFGAALLVG
jgi:predicted NBD/HSP70 family sugar kinase